MHIYLGNIPNYTPSKIAEADQQQRNGWLDIVTWAEYWGSK